MTPTASDLSEREQEILRLVATGASNKQIAQQLVISTNTVKVHLRNIFAKAGVSSRTEATLFAIREGLVVSPGGEVFQKDQVEVLIVPESNPTSKTRQPQKEFWAVAGLLGIIIISLLGISLRANLFDPPKRAATQSSSHWQIRASLPTARSGLAAAVFEEQIFAFGGEGKSGVTGEVVRYVAATDKWETMPDMPTPVADIGAVVIGGKIYIPGGRLPSGENTDILQVYNPRLNTWTEGTKLPIRVSAYGLAALDGKIYLFGGWSGSKVLGSVYLYDPETNLWEQKTDMPTARAYAGAVTVNGKIFIIGGYDGTKGLRVNEVYTPELDTGNDHPWDIRAPLPAPRYAMGIINQADIIYLLGGITGDNSQNIPLVYQFQLNEWQEFETPPKLAGSHLSLAAMNSSIYMLGGKLGSNPNAETQVYQAIFTISFPIIR
jgi:DNA-binding CsgD family transcriptional regulator/N-acetylneuraminic acid mutarotase